MGKIKTRETVKDIKALDKAAVAGERMRDAFIRTKDHAQNLMDDGQVSPSEYASDQMQYAAEDLTREAGHAASSGANTITQQGKKAYRRHQAKKAERTSADEPLEEIPHNPTKPTVEPEPTPQEKGRAKAKADAVKKKASAQTAPKSAPSASHATVSDTPAYSETPAYRQGKVHARQSIEAAKDTTQKTIKTAKQAERTVKQTAKSTGKATVKTAKGTIKTSQKAIKTAETTSKTAIKTSKAAAQAAQKTAVATARAARATVAAAKAAAKAAVVAAKAIAKATVAAVKAIIAGVKALIAAIAAGGWVAVVAIVIICLVALLVASCFGIFFSSEDTGSNQTMQQVVQEINEEYLLEIDNIKYSVEHDELEMSGARAVWPEVLAIYAVKTTTDPDNPQEVASITDEKIELLRDIFWAMNDIDYRTNTFTDTEIVESDDGNGNIVEEEVEVTKTYLYITVSHKTADEMAAEYNFNEDQLEQLEALLADENNSLWTAVLYGISTSDDQIVAVALSQIGNVGGQPYWSWYGFGSRVEWCACFVSWCANECGYIDTGVIPKFAGCVNGVNWFRDRGQWADNSAEPTPGMIIFFDWDSPGGSSGPQDGLSDHVGIVEKVENGRVYTIEGNSGDSCRERSYPLGYYEILGYGIPAY